MVYLRWKTRGTKSLGHIAPGTKWGLILKYGPKPCRLQASTCKKMQDNLAINFTPGVAQNVITLYLINISVILEDYFRL